MYTNNDKIECTVTILNKVTNRAYKITEMHKCHYIFFCTPFANIKIGDTANITGTIVGNCIRINMFNNMICKRKPTDKERCVLAATEIGQYSLGWFIYGVGRYYLHKNGEIHEGMLSKDNWSLGYWESEKAAKDFYADCQKQFISSNEEL